MYLISITFNKMLIKTAYTLISSFTEFGPVHCPA